MKKLFCFIVLIFLLFTIQIDLSPDDFALVIEDASGTERSYTVQDLVGDTSEDTDVLSEPEEIASAENANTSDGAAQTEDENRSGEDTGFAGNPGETDQSEAGNAGSSSDNADDLTNDYFELEIAGSTGWIAAATELKERAAASSDTLQTISAGTAFCIKEEDGGWWRVALADGTTGYVLSDCCMINLPDILPTIVYDITNSYFSIYKSWGHEIDGVTGEKLYEAGTYETEGKVWNERLDRYEYLVPVMYSAAKKIAIAQYNAHTVTGGSYTLKIYDSYRPHSVTVEIASALSSLYSSNSEVREHVDYSTESSGATYTWGYSWFLAQSLSTHNTASAIDVTLCEYDEDKGEYVEMTMQTDVHELSTAAIKYYSGSVEKVPANYSDAMTDNAKLLDSIFIGGSYEDYTFQESGMSTLASEWWHFQDDATHSRVRGYVSDGCDFQVTECLSE